MLPHRTKTTLSSPIGQAFQYAPLALDKADLERIKATHKHVFSEQGKVSDGTGGNDGPWRTRQNPIIIQFRTLSDNFDLIDHFGRFGKSKEAKWAAFISRFFLGFKASSVAGDIDDADINPDTWSLFPGLNRHAQDIDRAKYNGKQDAASNDSLLSSNYHADAEVYGATSNIALARPWSFLPQVRSRPRKPSPLNT